MSDDARDLARAFAVHLSHLRDAWGVGYVGADPVPMSDPAPEDARAPEPVSPRRDLPASDAAASVGSIAPTTSAGSAPAPTTRAATTVDPRRALREQATQWTPATKLEYLRRKNIGDCRRCPLHRTRTNIVFGVGSAEADLMFVGEAPGADEDRRGEPFVGRAGRRLTEWIEALGLRRQDVYIANVLKCRPPGNRDPRPDEVDKCSPFLQAQIRAIKPKVIVALGRHAGMLLSRREDMTLRAMRASQLSYDTGAEDDAGRPLRVPLVVTYHPAYVLRQEGDGGGDGGGGVGGRVNETVLDDLRRALAMTAVS